MHETTDAGDDPQDDLAWHKQRRVFSMGYELSQTARDRLLEREYPNDPEARDQLFDLWHADEESDRIFDRFFEKPDDGASNWTPGLAGFFLFSKQNGQPESLQTRTGRYQIHGEIGSGGMGSVYKARQIKPVQRTVAIKVFNKSNSSELLARFQVEEQALARLEHENIAPIFESGVTQTGIPFYTMPFLDGEPIDVYCENRDLDVKQRLRLMQEVCHGLNHAHRRGVIHRDIKPSNILVLEREQKAVPKIIDFGIAKLEATTEEQASPRTTTGVFMGTLEYMAPEQLSGEAETLSDVYGLGALLYRLLTGFSPLQQPLRDASGLEAKISVIRDTTPCRPSQLTGNNALRGDLDAIALKALDRNPENRYSGCQALVEDLENHLQNRPVNAREPSFMNSVTAWSIRHRNAILSALFLSLAGSAVLLTTLLVVNQSLRRETAMRKKQQAQIEVLRNILRHASPNASGLDMTVMEALNHTVPDYLKAGHTDAPELDAALIRYHRDVGLYPAAISLARNTLVYETDRQGPNHPNTLKAELVLAHILVNAGHHAEAETRYQAIISSPSPDQALVLEARSGLAALWQVQGKGDQAVALFKHTLIRQAGLLGENHRQTLSTRNNFANTLIEQGDYGQAYYHLNLLYPLLLNQFGAENHRTRHVSMNIALALAKCGDNTAAETMAWDNFWGLIRSHKINHPSSITALYNLSVVLTDQGRYNDAITLLEVLNSPPPDIVSDPTPDLLKAQNNLAECYRRTGRLRDAHELLQAVLAQKKLLLGENHYSTHMTRATLAQVLLQQGGTQAAQSIFCEVLQAIQTMPEAAPQFREAVRKGCEGSPNTP